MTMLETTAPGGVALAPPPGRVAEVLGRTGGLAVLHDRRLRPAGGAIDCLAVAPAGVFVVDAPGHEGKVGTRKPGGRRSGDERLTVDRRDRTALLDGLDRKVAQVTEILGDSGLASVPVFGVLCFLGARWPLFLCRPLRLRGAVALWPEALPKHVTGTGSLDRAAMARATDALARALAPASG